MKLSQDLIVAKASIKLGAVISMIIVEAFDADEHKDSNLQQLLGTMQKNEFKKGMLGIEMLQILIK